MKVLMLNYEFPPLGGGAANANYYLLKEFSKYKDIKIDLITSSADKFRIEKFSENITLYRLNVRKKSFHYQTFNETFLWSIGTFSQMLRLLKVNKYDLCHSWTGWPAGFFGYLFSRKLPYLVALRGSDVPGFNPRFKIADKLIFPFIFHLVCSCSKSVVANSQGLKELALKSWQGDIDVIYNGINTEEFYPERKAHKGITLLTVSRLIKRKGIAYLILAMPKILKYDKNVKLMIAGEGPEEKKLKSMAKKHSLPVTFLGRVKHEALNKVYNESDIFILPSINEGMSNTVLEAMSCGLPIITTGTGGTKELIKGNGIIIDKQSSVSISDAAIELLKDHKKMRSYGEKSRELAMKLSWSNVAHQYYNLYKGIS